MRKLSIAALLLVLTACGTTGGSDILGSIGSILGSPSASQTSDVTATVNSIDTTNSRINVTTSYINQLRDTQSGQWIYYDSGTQVVYQNRTYGVTDLERGDEISIRGANNNGRYVAQTITVTRNVRQ